MIKPMLLTQRQVSARIYKIRCLATTDPEAAWSMRASLFEDFTLFVALGSVYYGLSADQLRQLAHTVTAVNIIEIGYTNNHTKED